MVHRGQTVELRIESAAFEGQAVGRIDGLVIFVRYALPGDLVRARIIRKRRKYLEGVVEELLEPSPDRVEPRCRYFGTCGGCTLQNADYRRQLDYKRDQVVGLFERIGRLKGFEVADTLACPRPFYYRNKMEFSFGTNRWLTRDEIESGRELRKGFAVGLHIPGRFDKILDLQDCYLQSEVTPRIVNWIRQYCLERDWAPYHSRKHSGYLRNLVVRMGTQTGEIMVNLVTSRLEMGRAEVLAPALRTAFPEVTTFLNTINATRSPVAAGEEVVLFGSGILQERIGGLLLEIAPTTFFQPNSLQAERLYSTIAKMAGLEGRQIVWDLFCGLGGIGLYLAGSVCQVIGVESDRRSVGLAERNAGLNRIENCTFHTLDAAEALKPEFVRIHGVPDLVVLDPPRMGLHPKVCRRILELSPARIVYTSCNPATQARDLKDLASRYTIEAVQPVDMFPQTYHIENVVALSRNR